MIQSITFFKSPDDILKSHDKNTKVDCKNTWDDWHILAESRPVFAPPEPKTNYIDVPGGNGSLDLSEALTRYPTYNNRTGTFKFKVMNDYEVGNRIVLESNDRNRWAQRYSEIMEYLHGKCLYAVLDDDPTWFYQGRFTVDSWESNDTWSVITIGYNVNPFKWNVSSSTSDWLWDPFNFETGVTWDTICTDIEIDNQNGFSEMQFPPYTLDSDSLNTFFGGVPISPTITFKPKCPTHHNLLTYNNGILRCPKSSCGELDKGIDIRFVNSYLDIDITMNFKGGTTFAPDFIFYGQTRPYKMYFKGVGTISIDFRVGRL